MATTRTTLGKRFSEGARLAWRALTERGWTASDLRERMTGPSGSLLGVGVVDRVLYGDSLPSLPSASQIETLLGVPMAAWARSPSRRFVLPAAKRHAAKMTTSTGARKTVRASSVARPAGRARRAAGGA